MIMLGNHNHSYDYEDKLLILNRESSQLFHSFLNFIAQYFYSPYAIIRLKVSSGKCNSIFQVVLTKMFKETCKSSEKFILFYPQIYQNVVT